MSDSNLGIAADKRQPDVIVIGGGMGGGAVAYQLVERGLHVLLIEKGRSEFRPDQPNLAAAESDDPEQRLSVGHWPKRFASNIKSIEAEIWPTMGCGLGGSTLLYGAALGRFERSDMTPRRTPSGEEVTWPVGMDVFELYYRQAESLLRVRGTVDPRDTESTYRLAAPPAMNEADRQLFQSMHKTGLQPYRQHVGIDYVPGCTECGGHVCVRNCKSDARNCFIEPATQSGRLEIWSNSEVIELHADRDVVRTVRLVKDGRELEIRAPVVVLAAGALCSPVLLQRSVSSSWPDGIGNQHDLLGRYLMFHTSDFFAVWQKGKPAQGGISRTLASRAYYEIDSLKLGELQSTGLAAGYGEILHFLNMIFERSRLGKLRFLRHFLRIPAHIAVRLFREATVLANIIEDFPYPDNRVTANGQSPSGIRIDYAIHNELRERVMKFRELLKTDLSDCRVLTVNHDVELNLGHPCGTLRFGEDPKKSVLDPHCRVHGVRNLYVTDGSFLPASGGTNPSLTIAANALRVADSIADARDTLTTT